MCPICGKVFDSLEALDLHTEQYLGNFSHKCPDCTMTFECRDEISGHMLDWHERELRDIENTYFTRCPQCVMTFKSCDGIMRHTRAAHELDTDGVSHQRLPGDVECPQDLSMEKSITEEQGVSISEGGFSHKCPDCNLIFENRDEINVHLLEEHNRELQLVENTRHIKCPNCVMSFKSWDRLNRHAEAAHGPDLSDEEHVDDFIPKAPEDDENEEDQLEFGHLDLPKPKSTRRGLGDPLGEDDGGRDEFSNQVHLN